MKNQKRLIVAAVLGALIVAASIFGAGIAVAKNISEYPPIIQKLVERFGLDPAEVQKVFDEERNEKQKAMQTRFQDLLEQAVKDGKITAKQKEVIITKQAEMRKTMDELRASDLSPEERWKKMHALREEIKSWADKNNIDLRYLYMFGRGMGRGSRFGGPGPGGSCWGTTGTTPRAGTMPCW